MVKIILRYNLKKDHHSLLILVNKQKIDVFSKVVDKVNKLWEIGQIKINYKKYTMRIGKKKPRNQPCRSPSPDIANRSIIKNTTIEVDDIKSKMKKVEEKEIKFQLESSFSILAGHSDLNASFDGKYKQLLDEYTKMKLQIKQLSEQNKLLNSQNKRLSQKEDRQKAFSQLTGALLSRNENEPVLREKVTNLEVDKRNLQRELNQQRQKYQLSLKNIEQLRFQEQFLKDQLVRIAASDSHSPEPAMSQRDQQLKLTLFTNNLFTTFETNFRSRLNELNHRINKIQVQQKIIRQTHSRLIAQSRLNKTPISYKSSRKVVPSTGKAESKSKELSLSNYRSEQQPYGTSSPPSAKRKAQDSVEKIEIQNFSLNEQLRAKNYEILRLKQEKDHLISTLQDFQKDKKSSTPKFRQSDDNIFKKMTNLEAAIKAQQDQNQTLHFENERLNRLILQKTNEIQQLHNFIEHQKKIIKSYEIQLKEDKQCRLCCIKNNQIQQLKNYISKLEEKYKKDLYELQYQLKIQREQNENKLRRNQSQSSQIFENLDHKYQKTIKMNEDLLQQLLNVKKMLEYIKQKFQLTQLSSLLQENFEFYTQIQEKFYAERQEYDRSLLQLRKALLTKQQQIASLQTKLSLKAKEAELLQIQVGRLKQLNTEFHQNSIQVLKTNLNFMNRDRIESKSKKFKQNNMNVLDKVKEGNDRLSILYQKVSNSIKLDFSRRLQ